MIIEHTPFCDIVQLVRQRIPFTFSRWGDGEWRAVLGKLGGVNCDGHQFYPQMGEELRQVLISKPTYLLGMQPMALRIYEKPINEFLAKHGLQDLKWLNADVIHSASIHDNLGLLISAMRGRLLVMVGPDQLKRVSPQLQYQHFVEVPPRNCYLALDRIVHDVLNILESQKEHTIVSVSASMPAEIILDRLYKRIGTRHTLIDFGSVWDPFVGVYSRSYMKAKLRRANPR